MRNGVVFRRILCAIDFERNSLDALELAAHLAEQNSATICLLTVIVAPIGAIELPPVPLETSPALEAVCRARLDAIGRERLANIPHEVFVVSGNAAPQVLKLAREQNIDLIVMGTHGRTGVRHFILGSAAERVVRESPVPVLTVRPGAAG